MTKKQPSEEELRGFAERIAEHADRIRDWNGVHKVEAAKEVVDGTLGSTRRPENRDKTTQM